MHHRVRYAVALAKNTDSLLKGMILFDQGGGGEGDWGKYHGGNHSPPSVRGPPVFLLLLARRIFSVFLWSQKYWRETHLLDPLLLQNDSAGAGNGDCKPNDF
jgi:hypothetical protein